MRIGSAPQGLRGGVRGEATGPVWPPKGSNWRN
jgi:hypothetical protein